MSKKVDEKPVPKDDIPHITPPTQRKTLKDYAREKESAAKREESKIIEAKKAKIMEESLAAQRKHAEAAKKESDNREQAQQRRQQQEKKVQEQKAKETQTTKSDTKPEVKTKPNEPPKPAFDLKKQTEEELAYKKKAVIELERKLAKPKKSVEKYRTKHDVQRLLDKAYERKQYKFKYQEIFLEMQTSIAIDTGNAIANKNLANEATRSLFLEREKNKELNLKISSLEQLKPKAPVPTRHVRFGIFLRHLEKIFLRIRAKKTLNFNKRIYQILKVLASLYPFRLKLKAQASLPKPNDHNDKLESRLLALEGKLESGFASIESRFPQKEQLDSQFNEVKRALDQLKDKSAVYFSIKDTSVKENSLILAEMKNLIAAFDESGDDLAEFSSDLEKTVETVKEISFKAECQYSEMEAQIVLTNLVKEKNSLEIAEQTEAIRGLNARMLSFEDFTGGVVTSLQDLQRGISMVKEENYLERKTIEEFWESIDLRGVNSFWNSGSINQISKDINKATKLLSVLNDKNTEFRPIELEMTKKIDLKIKEIDEKCQENLNSASRLVDMQRDTILSRYSDAIKPKQPSHSTKRVIISELDRLWEKRFKDSLYNKEYFMERGNIDPMVPLERTFEMSDTEWEIQRQFNRDYMKRNKSIKPRYFVESLIR